MWGLVVGETLLLLLLLRALGALKLQNRREQDSSPSYDDIGGLKIGDIAPSFAAKDEHGHVMDLAESDEKLRLLIFLKPGCTACSDAIALVNEYLERENHADVYLFGLADQDANTSYAAQHFLRIPLWTPLTSSCEKMYDIRWGGSALPTTTRRDTECLARRGASGLSGLPDCYLKLVGQLSATPVCYS